MFSATRSRTHRVVALSLIVLGTLTLAGPLSGAAAAQTAPATPAGTVSPPLAGGAVVATPTGVGLIEPMTINRPPAPRIKTYPPITMAPKPAPEVLGIVIENAAADNAATAPQSQSGRATGTVLVWAGLVLAVGSGVALGARRSRSRSR